MWSKHVKMLYNDQELEVNQMQERDINLKAEHQNNFDLNLYHFGEEICLPSHHFGPAVRDHYLIHYIISGKGFFERGSKKWQLEQDMCFLIHPNEVTYYKADEEDPWHYVWIGFNGARASELLRKCGFSIEKPCLTYSLKSEFDISHHILGMLNHRTFEDSSVLWQMGQLYILLSELTRNNELVHSGTHVKTTKEVYVHKTIEFMLNNYSHEITICDVANYVGLDRSYFFAIFKELMQLSPKEFLTELRVKRAKELMLSTGLNFYEIAFSVGYKDPFLFSKTIKKYTGLSPSQFRAKGAEG